MKFDIDKEDKFHLSPTQKDFIKYYIEFKNIQIAASMVGIDEVTAIEYFKNFGIQEEIERINKEIIIKRFKVSSLNLDQLGSYLTTLITNENVPLHEQLNKKEKLDAVKLYIQLYQSKKEYEINNNVIDYTNTISENELEELNIDTIKYLIENKESEEEKKKKLEKINQINEMNDYKLTITDKALLNNMSNKEIDKKLEKIIKTKNDIEKEEK